LLRHRQAEWRSQRSGVDISQWAPDA
jgi:hypothetical protein